MRQDFPQTTVRGYSIWRTGCLIYPHPLVLAWCSAAMPVGKARVYQKADDQEAHQPTWTAQAHPCRRSHCFKTMHRPQTQGSQRRNWCLCCSRASAPRDRCPTHLSPVSDSSSAPAQKHLSWGQGCPKAVNEYHTSWKCLIRHSGVAMRGNCMAIKQNYLVPVN